MWEKFVVGSLLALRVYFPGFPLFLPPQPTNTPDDEASSLNIVIYCTF